MPDFSDLYLIMIALLIILSFNMIKKLRRISFGKIIGEFAYKTDKTRKLKKISYYLIGILNIAAFAGVLLSDTPTEDFLPELIQLLIISAASIFMPFDNSVAVTEKGFTGAGINLVRWDDIEYLKWDNDIGQLQWGFKLKRRGKSENRLFIIREAKELIERQLFKHQTGRAENLSCAS